MRRALLGFFLITFSFLGFSYSMDAVTKKINTYMIRKQKTEALDFLEKTLKSRSVESDIQKILSYKKTILESFLSEKAQNSYETTIVLMSTDIKKAKKSILELLEDDANNILFLWLDLKWQRATQSDGFKSQAEKFLQLTKNLQGYELKRQQVLNRLSRKDENYYLTYYVKEGEAYLDEHPEKIYLSSADKKIAVAKRCADILLSVYRKYIDDLNFCQRSP